MYLRTMRHILASILAFWILVAGSGLTVSQHYCQGEFAGSSLSLAEIADGCGMPMAQMKNSRCCHTDYQFYKAEDPGLTLQMPELPQLAAMTPLEFSYQIPTTANPVVISANSRAPPGKLRPVWMKYSVFLS